MQQATDDSYRLVIGTWYRRFLDGYSPYRVHITLDYPADALRHHSITPLLEDASIVSDRPGRLQLDIWFEGKLHLDIRFNTAR